MVAEEDTTLVEGPVWLKPLLKADFFATCPLHGVSAKSERNLFCFKCMGDGICASCAVDHKDHHVVQVRRIQCLGRLLSKRSFCCRGICPQLLFIRFLRFVESRKGKTQMYVFKHILRRK